ncbi:uncharacterized protein LOC119216596 isoform X2 [Pungitius pungitius]
MNWDNELSSILSGAEGSVSKMRERLTSTRNFSRAGEGLFPVRERIPDSDSVLPALPLGASPLRTPASPLRVQWSDLAAIQSQLQIQSQAIESLTHKVLEGERARQSQHRHIQALQEEVQELRERESRREPPGAQGTMEQWRRDVGRELSSLRGHISRVTLLGNPEESFSSKLRREELEVLSREVEQLKTHLSESPAPRRRRTTRVLRPKERRAGTRSHVFPLFTGRQQEEGRGGTRGCEHRSKILEELIENNTTLSTDVLKISSQCSHTQHQLHQIRTSVSQLRDEVKRLVIKEHQTSEDSLLLTCHGAGVRGEEAESDSEDLSPTPSLAEVSSDDLSWLEDKDTAPHQKPAVGLSVQSRRSNFTGLESDLTDDDDDLLDLDPGSGLSVDDL